MIVIDNEMLGWILLGFVIWGILTVWDESQR
jgi:hypothetical protein